MSLQRNVIETYLNLYNNPSLKEISKETGIQFTRVFRILNGMEMRITEYETFKDLIGKKIREKEALTALAEECLKKLRPSGIADLERVLGRRLQLWEIKQVSEHSIGSERTQKIAHA